MAGVGKAPKPIAKRAGHSKDPVAMRILPRFLADQPELPEFLVESDDGLEPFRWPDHTRTWWQMWADSPLSLDFTSTDWSELLDTALLHARVWSGELRWLPELRLRTAKFGATPEDRARLRIQFAQADEAESKVVVRRSSRDRFPVEITSELA
jgi:hypothetical protein